MFNFKNLFKASKSKTESRPEHFPPRLEIQTENSSIHASEINDIFYNALLGINSNTATALNPFEIESLKQLEQLLQQDLNETNLLPRMPLVLPQLLHSLRDENSDAAEITLLIEKDPVLVGDVMRLVNSPYYRTREKITTLQQATLMLGRDGLRKLVASSILKPLLNLENGHFSKLANCSLWDHSEKAAFAASILCTGDEENVFHAYLSGILNNIGFTVGFKVLDKIYDGIHPPTSIEFQQKFIELCKSLTLLIAKSWSMPDNICNALGKHPQKYSNQQSRIFSETLYIADKLSKAVVIGKEIRLDPLKTKVLVNEEPCSQCRYAIEGISQ